MLFARGETLIIALICVIGPAYSAGTKSISKVYEYPNHHVHYNHQSYKNGSLTYAVCEKSSDVTFKKCKIMLEKNIFEKERTQNTSCELTFRSKSGKKINNVIQVINFSLNKAIVLSWEEPQVQTNEEESQEQIQSTVTVISFPSCRTNANTLVSKASDFSRYNDWPYDVQAIPYDNTFDVIYPNKEICKDKFCRQTFSADGVKVSNMTGWFLRQNVFALSVEPIKPYSPLSGYAILECSVRPSNRVVLYYLSKNNDLATLRYYGFVGSKPYGYSLANNIISFCSQQMDKIVMCSKFGKKGLINFEKSLTFNYSIHTMFTHNSRSGEFLFLTSSKENSMKSYDDKKAVYDLMKFDASGEYVAAIKIENLSCKSKSVWAKFFESGNDEYCLLFMCLYPTKEFAVPNDGHLILEYKCFPEKDLSKM